MANIILSRLNSSAIALKSGKAVMPTDCISEVQKENGAGKVIPLTKKAIRDKYSLTASEAEYAHRQVCLRIKTAESAAFSAMSSDSDVVGLGMKQSASGQVWFGLLRKEAKGGKSQAPDTRVAEAEAKLAKASAVFEKLGLSKEEIAAVFA